jgi:hypothetical protein
VNEKERARRLQNLHLIWAVADLYDERSRAFRILEQHHRSGFIVLPDRKVSLEEFLRSQIDARQNRTVLGRRHSVGSLELLFEAAHVKRVTSRSEMRQGRERRETESDNKLESALRIEYSKDEQKRWLADIVDRLATCRTFKCRELKYWNHPDLPADLRVQGYYVCYQVTDRYGMPQYVMISRSNTAEFIELGQIVDELSSGDVNLPFSAFGDYYAARTTKRSPGTYATIKYADRWYMISVCGVLKPYHRLSLPDSPATRLRHS